MGIPKSTIQNTGLLLLIGLAMVLGMVLVTNMILGNVNDGTQTEQEYPTPTPQLNYVPIPEDDVLDEGI